MGFYVSDPGIIGLLLMLDSIRYHIFMVIPSLYLKLIQDKAHQIHKMMLVILLSLTEMPLQKVK